jgi:uncharacterized protein (DUF885 family)
MPGHYVQIWHSNKYPSTLRAVLSSGSFVEGWAVYAEKVMADEGFLDHDPLYRLVQLKWYLRSIANAILDQAIHVDGMSEQDAMKLMMEGTFQQEREAAGKWTRARLGSTQLPTYFVGVQEHLDLRKAYEAKMGDKFNLKAYHDRNCRTARRRCVTSARSCSTSRISTNESSSRSKASAKRSLRDGR